MSIIYSVFNVFKSLTNERYTGPKKVSEALFYGGIAGRTGKHILIPKDESEKEELTYADVLFVGATLFGSAFEFRVKNDFGSKWRDAMIKSIAMWMPPYEGLKDMMIDIISRGPIYVQPQYTNEVDRLIRAYNKNPSSTRKESVRRMIFNMALKTQQPIGFENKKMLIDGVFCEAHILRITLIKKSLHFNERYNTYEYRGPALYRPGLMGNYYVTAIPNIRLFELKNGTMKDKNLIKIMRKAQKRLDNSNLSRENIYIIYAHQPLT